MFKIKPSSLKWAIKHLRLEGDSDLFPPLLEINAINDTFKEFLPEFQEIDFTNIAWDSGRKFLIPKENLAFRSATQLNPLDSLLVTALLYQFGKTIENKRSPLLEKTVFSYRFSPTPLGHFFGKQNYWLQFWAESKIRAEQKNVKFVLCTDISDFYNQVSHHHLTNQLISAGLPNIVVSIIEKFLGQISNTVSRGIPIGPHIGHILAEASLIGIDKSLNIHSANWCRYADDFHFFSSNEKDAQIWAYRLAQILDKHQKLTLQKKKTFILTKKQFIRKCDLMLIDRPINNEESEIISTIKKHSNSNPYSTFTLNSLSNAELKFLEESKIQNLFKLYLKQDPINYSRIRWFLRRLRQCGAPGGIQFILDNFDKLTPVLGEITRYLISSYHNFKGELKRSGGFLFKLFSDPLIQSNEYFQIGIMNLFSQIINLNNIENIIAIYNQSGSPTKREILLAAVSQNLDSWLCERKDEFSNCDPWLKRAIIYSTICFPGDEGIHWLKSKKRQFCLLDRIVERYTKIIREKNKNK